jgi:hypothetical protein
MKKPRILLRLVATDTQENMAAVLFIDNISTEKLVGTSRGSKEYRFASNTTYDIFHFIIEVR